MAEASRVNWLLEKIKRVDQCILHNIPSLFVRLPLSCHYSLFSIGKSTTTFILLGIMMFPLMHSWTRQVEFDPLRPPMCSDYRRTGALTHHDESAQNDA